jgi:hypothetical protein
MKLMDLVLICNEGYRRDFPESSLLEFVNPRSGQPLLRMPSPIGDTLALFIVRELAETFDPDASDDEQIAETVRVMTAARDNLENVISALVKRQSA